MNAEKKRRRGGQRGPHGPYDITHGLTIRMPKREDPERMGLRCLKAALCTAAGPEGDNCAECLICNYGRQWIKRRTSNESGI